MEEDLLWPPLLLFFPPPSSFSFSPRMDIISTFYRFLSFYIFLSIFSIISVSVCLLRPPSPLHRVSLSSQQMPLCQSGAKFNPSVDETERASAPDPFPPLFLLDTSGIFSGGSRLNGNSESCLKCKSIRLTDTQNEHSFELEWFTSP